MIIEVNGLSIEIIKKPVKNITLRVYPPDGRVRVSAPLHYKEKNILHFLHKHQLWIEKQRQRMSQSPPPVDELLTTGSRIQFKGESYVLVIQKHHGPAHVTCLDSTLKLHLPHEFNPDHIKLLLDNWYKSEMHAALVPLIKHWEKTIQVQVHEWGIKKMKTRWGSCNPSAKRIWLNLNLIKKPMVCLEYVLVHELIHLLEKNHNERFYRLMEQFLPQWRAYDYLLEGRATRKAL